MRDHVALAVDDVEVRRAAGVLAVIARFAHGREPLRISFAQCLRVSDESVGTRARPRRNLPALEHFKTLRRCSGRQ